MGQTDPRLVDNQGETLDARLDDYPEGMLPGTNAPYATRALAPLGWNHGGPDGTRMVGWTMHGHGSGKIVEQHAFNINPQSITRQPTGRNQLQQTQGGFYLDDFGSGSETITISQMVAHGRDSAGQGGSLQRATMRDDVIRFYDFIYTKMAANPGHYDLYFHDGHFWPDVTRRVPELVYFPPQAVQVVRSVTMHNVWQVSITMGTLNATPPAVKDGLPTAHRIPARPYIVRRGDTLTKIVHKLALGRTKAIHGKKHVSAALVKSITNQIVTYTRRYGSDDITKQRRVAIHDARNAPLITGYTVVSRMHLAPGEKIYLPTGR